MNAEDSASAAPSLAGEDGGLRWRTGDTSRRLIQAFAISLGMAATTGLLLSVGVSHDNLSHVLLLTHLASSLLALLFFVPFVVIHWRDGREPLLHLVYPFRLMAGIRRDPYALKRLLGHALMWSLFLVLLSGLLISLPAIAYLSGQPQTLPYGGHAVLLRIHAWLSPLLVLALALHLPGKDLS